MDFVEGTDAARLLADHGGGGLPPEDVVRIVSGVADALDYAHQQYLLHRDVKPSNILLAQSDSKFSRALLADFGIARSVADTADLTATNMTVGTVAYAAPEQLMGQALDGRADQYALAATAFHLLTGQQLFQHDNPAVVISNHLTASPPAIGDRIPELSGLGPAFERALAKSPADRFDSCNDFAEAMAHGLSDAAHDLGATDRTVAAPASGKQRKHTNKDAGGSRRLRLGLLAAGAAAVLVGGAIAVGVAIANREEPALSVRRRRRLPALRLSRWSGSVRTATRSVQRASRRAGSRRTARDWRRPIPTLVGLSGHRADRSDGRARSYRRGVSGGHRGTGSGLRESNGEDPSRMPQRHPRRQPVRAGLADPVLAASEVVAGAATLQ